MARKHLISIALLGIIAGGCVSQEKYNALKLDRDRYAEQLGQAQQEAGSARAEADAYKNQLTNLGTTGTSKEAMILNLTNQNSELQRQLDDLNRKYADAAGKVGSPLPEALNTALLDFARQNPDLVDFDSAHGMVKFKSDVTFSPGSAEVTTKAKEAIARFAQILNSSAAAGYELMVAGHTDNTNVINPVTLQAGHKNNWYLSAHRAIAVGSILMSQGVNGQRLAVTGYADQRPIASNNSESGKAANRRVEVLILPTQVRGPQMASERIAPTAPPMKSKAKPQFNKDSIVPPTAKTETNSAFTK
jgi:chemotaxis protein MotB